MSPQPAATRGYSATKDQLLNRLRRIEGQVRGVQKMVDEDRVCTDIVTQIAAIEAALDKVALGLLDGHLRHCVARADPVEREAETAEVMQAVARWAGR
jgi:DNA-binding FrmR family transcriptional regulator